MFHIIPPDSHFDFMKKRKIWISLSILAIVLSFYGLFTKGLNYGIDFTGGAEVKVHVPQTWNTGTLRETLEKGGLTGLKILQLGSAQDSEYMIRAQEEGKDLNQVVDQMKKSLSSTLQPNEFEIKSADIVGPSAGGLLRKNGLLAAFYALLAILLYVAIRFDFRYAPGAVVALFHDAVVVIGVFIVFQIEFDLTVLAAILALIGYSNNDTIIVFDRIRETLKLNPGKTIEDVVNESVNQTLGRTIMTSICTFVSVAALYLFGGHVLQPFSFALMTGIIVGCYSSVFIASSLVIVIAHYREDQAKSGKGKKRREVKLSPEAHIGI
ncbi:MAG: protein translocase subunit SecF [Bdellovibrionales bacterium]|nr:protein translocase subunit SecF [Bdellovibrionales bacterium]